MRSLRDLGKTVVLTTHYLDEAQALADRVAIIKDGAILAEGPPGTLSAGRAPYRVTWRVNGTGAQVRETDDPTTLLHELTAAALTRGERLEDLERGAPEPRGCLPRADGRGCGGGRGRPGRGARGRARVSEPAVGTLGAGPAEGDAPAGRPWLAQAWAQYRLERRMFWRNPSAAFFNFAAAAAPARALRRDLQRPRRRTST